MDSFLNMLSGRSGNPIIDIAMRSGLLKHTARFTYEQCSRLLQTVNDKAIHAELRTLQKLLDSKVKILSPSIDLIEFKSGRGNVFLESAVPLAKSLHREIVRLGKRLDDAATSEEAYRLAEGRRKRAMSDAYRTELMLIIKDMKALIARIDRDIPLIHLAITNSGEKMNSAMSPGISPSRMMQASWLLNYADLQFAHNPNRPVQIGPSFTLSLYMLFLGHSKTTARPTQDNASLPSPEPSVSASGANEEPYGLGEGERKPIWQEVMHKARVRLCRTPLDWTFEQSRGYCPKTSPDPEVTESYSATSAITVLAKSDQYSYHLEIIEDLDDGRVHDEGPKPEPLEGMPMAGMRESIPIHQISKIFYTNTGRLLNIGGTGEGDNNPVLLLKRDVGARAPIGLREDWFNESEGSLSSTTDSLDLEDDQLDIDRQLQEESKRAERSTEELDKSQSGHLPPHLDQEWLALEIFTDGEEDEEDDSEDEDGVDGVSNGDTPKRQMLSNKSGVPRDRTSIDSPPTDQLRRISIGPKSPEQAVSRFSSGYFGETQIESPRAKPLPTRSTFGVGLTSLSLLEMMIRLTSLQEFQQTPHLSIPDHILTFFLDETSTTGTQDEAHWAIRSEAKRRVGFDPYTDTPSN